MAIPSEWAGLPVSPTLPYLRVSKVCLMHPGRIKQTVYSRRWGRVGETGGPAHSDGVAICRSSNALLHFNIICYSSGFG